MRKSMILFLVCCLLLCAISFTSCGGSKELFNFEQKKDDTLIITAFYKKNDLKYTSVEIPATYMNKTVTEIGAQVFEGNATMTSIILPDSITVIGDSAFANCSHLTEINLPEGLTTIGEWAFYNCSNITSLTLPLSVDSIGTNAFNGMASLTSYTGSMKHMPMIAADKLTEVTLIATEEDYLSPAVFHLCKNMTKLTYTATKSEWEAMKKAEGWLSSYPRDRLVVHCTDGDIIYEKNME